MHFNMMRYWKIEDHFNPESCHLTEHTKVCLITYNNYNQTF